MSRFASNLINCLSPYVPGEQPKGKSFIKLNTNENPYFTSIAAVKRVEGNLLYSLNRYSDPESLELTKTIADYYGVGEENVLVTNGSDEALAFAFFAYGGCGVCFPDVTYGFYGVIANLFGCNVKQIPLKKDFTVDINEFFKAERTVVLANPNAQTGIELGKDNIEKIISNNLRNIVILDQAYADFGNYNAIGLTKKYDNLIVVNTFSKSRSLAGARVGYVIAHSNLIADLKKVKNSFHPYNVNSVSAALAMEAIRDDGYFKVSLNKIKNSRRYLAKKLEETGFYVLPSAANFILAKHEAIKGEELYLKLKEKGVLVRHFTDERIKDFVRITVGTDEEIEILLKKITEILKENAK